MSEREDRIAAHLRAEAMKYAAEAIAKNPNREKEILERLASYEPVRPKVVQ